MKSGYSITFVSLHLFPSSEFDVEIFSELVGTIFFFYFVCQHFKPNPYFEDSKLTKTFTFLEEGTTKITATNIKWKEGMVSFDL